MTPNTTALIAFSIAGMASYIVTPLTSRVALRFGILDHPNTSAKAHPSAVPYLGGIAIFVGLIAGASLLLFLGDYSATLPRTLGMGIAIAIALGIIGVVDDIRSLPRSLRLIAQVLAGIGAWSLGFRVEALGTDWANIAVTVIWIVGITNAFNLLDNMDGLSAGLAGIGALSFAVIGGVQGLYVVTVVAAALAGAAGGFLAHNRHPAKIFMGDAGSLFLGFLLAILGIELRFENLQTVTFLVPVVVLGIPIFDTTLVVISRLLHSRSVFEGGRDHISHRLVRIGLPVRAAVGLMYLSQLGLGWLGLTISLADAQIAWMLLAFVIALGILLGGLLLRVPVYAEDPTVAKVVDAADPDEVVHRMQGRSA